MSLLEINGLSSGYGAIKVLHNISISVNKNEVVTILGPNGAGKTTIVMTIFNEVKASSGDIYFDQNNLIKTPTHKISKLGISLVPEGRRIFPKMSVYENLLLGNLNKSKIINSKLDEIYSFFPILFDRKNISAGLLSGGEQQMLAIGRAIISSPKLLILDEPSLGLSPKITLKIYDILKEIAKNTNTSILLVEQNVNHAIKLADRFYILSNGEIQKSGTKEDFLNNQEIREHYLGR